MQQFLIQIYKILIIYLYEKYFDYCIIYPSFKTYIC